MRRTELERATKKGSQLGSKKKETEIQNLTKMTCKWVEDATGFFSNKTKLLVKDGGGGELHVDLRERPTEEDVWEKAKQWQLGLF